MLKLRKAFCGKTLVGKVLLYQLSMAGLGQKTPTPKGGGMKPDFTVPAKAASQKPKRARGYWNMNSLLISNRDKLLVIKLIHEFDCPKIRVRNEERLSNVRDYIATGKVYIFTLSSATGRVMSPNKYD